MNPARAAIIVLAAGLGLSVAMVGSLNYGGSALLSLSAIAGIWGAYSALVAVMLAARIPGIENRWGQTHVLAIHRLVGPACAFLITGHVIAVTIAYNSNSLSGIVDEFLGLVLDSAWMLPALAGFVAIAALSLSSYRRIRRRMKYETWWAAHLYMYLAVGMAFGHELFTGALMPANSWQRIAWVGLHVLAVGAVVVFRIWLPIARSLRHTPTLVGLDSDGTTVVLHLAFADLDRLKLRPGQFCYWRPMRRHLWWQAHPYSVLACDPAQGVVSIAVRLGGDFSRDLAALPIGTRFAFEGPYGVMTAECTERPRATLIGGGVGLSPLLGIVRSLDPAIDVRVFAALRADDDLMSGELQAAISEARARRATVGGVAESIVIIGGPGGSDLSQIATLPGLAGDDVFLCGPPGFTAAALSLVSQSGVPENQIHTEVFAT